MIQEPVPIKKICLWCLIVMLGIVAFCLVFISVVSIWAGLTNLQQAGFWVPILGGSLLFSLTLFFFVCIARRILYYMKEEDVLITG